MHGTSTQSFHRGARRGADEPLRLVVIDGPDRGLEVAVSTGATLIGTREGAGLTLTDPTVSRQHASIEMDRGRLRLRDLQSRNGTFYVGAAVTDVELPVGAIFQVGRSQICILPASVRPDEATRKTQVAGMVGRSPRMRHLFAELARVAVTDAPVLVRGETGVGKEEVARAIHALSKRSAGPFRVVDCGAIQPELFPSALLGHVKGAFTSADRDAAGALQLAHGGTLFFDEVGEIPLHVQPILLRVLESQAYFPVGSAVEKTADFRIIAATHVDLERAVARNRFRRDLFYRLSAIRLDVPPLRERPEDIALLVQHFMEELSKDSFRLPPFAIAAMTAYPWPGNVRELRNAVERAIALGADAALPGMGAAEEEPIYEVARDRALAAFEKSYLEALLARHRGSTAAAAKHAKVARSYLYKLLDRHQIRIDRRKG
jgi:DNA-binding NtrC family response regulator